MTNRRRNLDAMTVRCIVACVNASGEPDFFGVQVTLPIAEYNDGKHYWLAERSADHEGYEPKLVYDEDDAAGRSLLPLFDWTAVRVVTRNPEGLTVYG